ncbi:MAG: tetratricopeptide repeat protein [Pirellulales bacterium]|nr:tetratricopeptide repeat protein [Pirellulales bacterium]
MTIGTRGSGMRGSLSIFLCLFLAAPAAASPAPPLLEIEDAATRPAPDRPGAASDRDWFEKLVLLAEAKSHQDKGRYAEALRCFQRALRRDPQSAELALPIVSIAARLNRYAVAARYALLDVELNGVEPMLLRRLAVYSAGEGNYASAASLYEKAVAARRGAAPAADDVVLRMELGRLYLSLEKPRQAADCFDAVFRAMERPAEFNLDDDFVAALQKNPGPTCQLMGDCFLAAGRIEKARAAFRKADQFNPDKAARQYNLARLSAKTGKPSEALEALEACFAEGLGGRGEEPYKILAEVLDKLGRKDEVIDRLEKLHADDPDNQPLEYFLAVQLREAGEAGRAETIYRKLLDAKPSSKGYRELGEVFRRAERFDALLALLGESVEKLGVMETLAGAMRTLAAKPEAVRAILQAADRAAMKSSEKIARGTSLAAALLALETERFEKANLFFDLALNGDSRQDAEVYLIWGVGLLSANRSAESARVLRRAIDADVPEEEKPAFHFYLAGALAIEGRENEALNAARIAAEKNEYSARFRGRPAWILYYCNRNKEAAEAYRNLIDEFDADHSFAETREVLREARMALSNLAVLAGDQPQAEEWLEQVLDEFPDDPGALNDLGYLWADQGKNLRRAEQMIRRAVAAEPQNAAYRDSLGWVLFRMKKYPQAVAQLERAAADKEPDGVVLDHLGEAYLKIGQRSKAVETWSKAAEVFRKHKELKKEKEISSKIMQYAN